METKILLHRFGKSPIPACCVRQLVFIWNCIEIIADLEEGVNERFKI
jgi:hypothetical protein